MASAQYFVCSCFFSRNIFLHQYEVHVVYHTTERFLNDFGQLLNKNGCSTRAQQEAVVHQIEEELSRRRKLGADSLERTELIKKHYIRFHPGVYNLQENYFHSDFLSLWRYCLSPNATVDGALQLIENHRADRVFSFPVFTTEFCTLLQEEVVNFESSNSPKGRPNTMNKYGVLLSELGFDENFMNPLRLEYLTPIARLLYPDWGGSCLDSHKAFIVRYKTDEDRDLSYHYDNAEVTINVSLGGDFTEGQIYFGGMRDIPVTETECTVYSHRPGHGLIHRGQHKHGAMPILSGERFNLIIWMRSSKVRNELCPMCDEKPRLVETVGYGDGFTSAGPVVNVCSTA